MRWQVVLLHDHHAECTPDAGVALLGITCKDSGAQLLLLKINNCKLVFAGC
jgi:hypothetical protein